MDLRIQELDTLKDVFSLLAADATTNQDMRRLTWAMLAVTSLGVVVALSQRFLPEVVIVILIAVVILTWICLVTLILIKKRRSAQASVEESIT
jgi:sensor histidine kinase YesM